MFHFLEKVNKGHLKMVNVNYLKWPHLAILLFNKIIKEPSKVTSKVKIKVKVKNEKSISKLD